MNTKTPTAVAVVLGSAVISAKLGSDANTVFNPIGVGLGAAAGAGFQAYRRHRGVLVSKAEGAAYGALLSLGYIWLNREISKARIEASKKK